MATLHAGLHQAMESASALATCEILAAFVFRCRRSGKLFERWRVTRLADGMLSGTTLARSKRASIRGWREADWAGECRLRSISNAIAAAGVVQRKRRNLLVAATVSISGRRRERRDILLRWRRFLWREALREAQGL